MRTGWWAAMLGRIKDIKTPAHWLQPAGGETSGESKVLAMLRRRAGKAER